jgi:hypothetical protein
MAPLIYTHMYVKKNLPPGDKHPESRLSVVKSSDRASVLGEKPDYHPMKLIHAFNKTIFFFDIC